MKEELSMRIRNVNVYKIQEVGELRKKIVYLFRILNSH